MNVLLLVSSLSLLLALVMSAAAWRILREERRRSAARIAALAAAIAEVPAVPAIKDAAADPPAMVPEGQEPRTSRPGRPTADEPSASGERSVAAGWPRRAAPQVAAPLARVRPSPSAARALYIGASGASGASRQGERVAMLPLSIEGEDPLGSSPIHTPIADRRTPNADPADARVPEHLFAITTRSSHAGRRLAVVAAVAAVAVALGRIGLGVIASHAPAVAGANAPAYEAAATAPLELVSLQPSREGNGISITGLVRNPVHGVELRRLTAVVFLFNKSGAFVTSVRAPLDFPRLAPGDESPFVVSLARAGTVGRYRISFRTEDGTVVPHVDRRGPAPDAPAPAIRQSESQRPLRGRA